MIMTKKIQSGGQSVAVERIAHRDTDQAVNHSFQSVFSDSAIVDLPIAFRNRFARYISHCVLAYLFFCLFVFLNIHIEILSIIHMTYFISQRPLIYTCFFLSDLLPFLFSFYNASCAMVHLFSSVARQILSSVSCCLSCSKLLFNEAMTLLADSSFFF